MHPRWISFRRWMIGLDDVLMVDDLDGLPLRMKDNVLTEP